MPKVFLTNQQRRTHAVNRAITIYLFETGETKKSFAKRIGMPLSTFYKKQRNPEEFTLGEFWVMLDALNVPLEQRGKLLE